jgi:hypothetical protein
MKKFILTIFFGFIIINCVFSQLVFIPDTNFKNRLINLGYGSCITGNYIDSSDAVVKSTLSLDIQSSNIYSIRGIEAFSNLVYFNCSWNNITNVYALPLSVTDFFCGNNQITQISGLPPQLRAFYCNNNLLTSLPTLYSPSLSIVPLLGLFCNNNQLSSLPLLPPSLEHLDCSYNQFATIPDLSSLVHLESLYCDDNQLTTLPNLYTGLRVLSCNHNLLSSLPVQLPFFLSEFYCDNNLFTNLPALPTGLSILKCSHNQLSSLPTLSTLSLLNILICDHNQLTSLSTLPNQCTEIDCSYNLLTAIPSLPVTLIKLTCTYNQLTNLPTLPNTLRNLKVAYNQLTSLPEIPDTLIEFYCNDNPGLTCLPKLGVISYLSFNNCSVNCIPNISPVLSSNPSMSTLPLCGPLNVNGCDFFWNVNGITFQTTDTNCIFSPGESGLSNIHYLLYENGVLTQQEIGLNDGRYTFDINNLGNYEIKIDSTSLPFDIFCPASKSYIDTVTVNDSLFYNNDFALLCKPGYDVGVFSIAATGFRPSKITTINILAGDKSKFFGAHCTSGIGGTVDITFSGAINYIGPSIGAIAPNIVAGNTLTYNISNFDSINSNAFSINVQTDTFALIGSIVCINVNFSNIFGDRDSSNDHLTNCFQVRSSFDPNDKLVYPFGTLDSTQKWLTYTINFQNTGTAEAENIFILDTLDANFNLETFQLLATSHPAFVQMLEGGILNFSFQNINLPDSNSNEPLSHGYVQYKIKLKDNLSNMSTISNRANIYFDFNPPVITNTTSVTLDLLNSVIINKNISSTNVSPVPFQNYLHIEPREPESIRFSIYNLFGENIFEGNINPDGLTLNTLEWTPGIYFLELYHHSGIEERKLLKL